MKEKEQISERRLVNRLTNYWERIKKDDEIPQIQKFNSAAIIEVWDFCFRVSVQMSKDTGTYTYKYEYVGSEIIRAYGSNPSGQLVTSKIKNIPGAPIFKKLDECAENKQCMVEQGRFINDKDKIVKYRSCILPFGTEGKDISDIIVGLSWRAY